MRWAAAVALLLAAPPQPLEAQRAPDWRPTLAAPDPLASERTAIAKAVRRSRWLEGAVIGGVVFAAAGGVLAGGHCGADDSAEGAAQDGCTEEILLGGVAGAAVGGLIGGLIGSRIRAGPPERDDFEPRLLSGNRAGRGGTELLGRAVSRF